MGVDGAVSTFCTDKWNSVTKMDRWVENIMSAKVGKIASAEISRKNCSVYSVSKKKCHYSLWNCPQVLVDKTAT